MKRVAFAVFGLLLLLFLGKTTLGISNSDTQQNHLAPQQKNNYNTKAVIYEKDYAERLDNLGITLHPGTDFTPDSKPTPSSLNHCKSLVYKTLKSLPQAPVKHLKNLTLYFTDQGRRGLGGGSTVILRCQNVTDEELVGVFTHEMGHIHDTGVMQGSFWSGESRFKDGNSPVYKNDPSVQFYQLSFDNEKKLKKEASKFDFVSGYAMSDPFEDFAESYAYYILHGSEFRKLTKSNKVLAQKYEFLKKEVFKGKEYYNGDESKVKVTTRNYDVTVLPYDLTKFFAL